MRTYLLPDNLYSLDQSTDRDSIVSTCGVSRAVKHHQNASCHYQHASVRCSASTSSLPSINLLPFTFNNYNLIKLKLNQTWLRSIRERSVDSARRLLRVLSKSKVMQIMTYSRKMINQQSISMLKSVRTSSTLITETMRMTQHSSSMNATKLRKNSQTSEKRNETGCRRTERA